MIKMSQEFKKQCEEAHYEYCLKHRWGDATNAGVNYQRGKNNPDKKKKTKNNRGQ